MDIKPITSWSFSRLSVFESCKLRAQLQYGQKIPEPERPLPPGKTEHANDRGTRIHTAAELFIKSEAPFAHELSKFRPEFEALQRLYAQGKVSLEGEWGMDQNWEPTEWKSAYQRLKLDALVFLSDYDAIVIDFKTGQKFGNEVKHAEQVQLYQLNTFLRYPKLEHITGELWYLDKDDITSSEYTRGHGLQFRSKFDKRARSMTTAIAFPANPNIFTCRYCPYGPTGTGHCTKGV